MISRRRLGAAIVCLIRLPLVAAAQGRQPKKIALLMPASADPHFWNALKVRAGALISYGTDYADHFRRAACFVDRILKGAKPGELPIEQATTFALVINRKTAAALGIRIPAEILQRATEVIE